jgi:hypothetical protein
MISCPVCDEPQLVYVAGPTVTSCYYCRARWVQEGSEQNGIERAASPPSTPRSGRPEMETETA